MAQPALTEEQLFEAHASERCLDGFHSCECPGCGMTAMERDDPLAYAHSILDVMPDPVAPSDVVAAVTTERMTAG